MDLETDPRDIKSLKQLAQGCGRLLDTILKEEDARESDLDVEKGHWASRQFAEFNMWCTKVGANDQGSRSIDIRLKDVPEICNIIGKLLYSLERDLEKLQQPIVETQLSVNTEKDISDAYSDGSSESFDSLSSLEQSEVSAIGDSASKEEQILCLQKHIEDTIDRLHGHALQIEKAGLKHRQSRIRIYQQKETPKAAFEAYNTIGYHKAKVHFPSATDAFHQRIAESFARRRIRFDYLHVHQKKRAIEATKVLQMSPVHPRPEAGYQDGGLQSVEPRTRDMPRNAEDVAKLYQEGQKTIYSATVNTKLEIRPEIIRQERADSVVSIALRHPGFPPPPQFAGASFQCPYCRLEFRAAEAGKARWSQHVMQDFEPYFCTIEECKAPFDMPNTFDGLLRHLQDHVEECFHVDLPNGEHKMFNEKEFEEYCTQQGDIIAKNRSMLKLAAQRKGAFMLEKCPFCGGYPDTLEKRYPDSNDPEAQIELRHHIKQHMQDIALFLPPYREDVFSKDDDFQSSVLTGERSGISSFGEPEHFVNVCGRENCDCKNNGMDTEELGESPEGLSPEHDKTDSWATFFPEFLRYDNSSVTEEYCLEDEVLRHLYTAKLRLAPKGGSEKQVQVFTSPGSENTREYTIAWICALHIEFAAAQEFLEEEYEDFPPLSHGDNNIYALGRVGSHNVVVAVLPDEEYGRMSAAAVARRTMNSFQNVRFVLMVGIGGGAPSSKHDVRLGDVVVGILEGGHGGAIQYDFDKTIVNENISLEHANKLGQPPAVLQAAVNKLKSQHNRIEHQLNSKINRSLAEWPRFKKKYSRPSFARDRLYKSDIIHPDSSEGCDSVCGGDPNNFERRTIRDEFDEDPAIHYGLIASSNQPIRDAKIRDNLAAKGIACFETEATGLMNPLPCLVIRGICDYSDSHKNSEWKKFAAMTAAAYAADLLHNILPNEVENERRISDAIVQENTVKEKSAFAGNEQLRKNIFHWLSPSDPSTNASMARERRHPGTGTWFLESTIFQEWKDEKRQHLWLYGLAGCGKTILSTTIFDHLKDIRTNPILSFFFDYNEPGKQTFDDFLRSLVFQLCDTEEKIAREVEILHMHFDSGKRQPDVKTLSIFVEQIMRSSKAIIVLDALDECITVWELLTWLQGVTTNHPTDNSKLIVTGRPEAAFQKEVPRLFGEANCTLLDKKSINADIKSYVTTQLQGRQEFTVKSLPNDLVKRILKRVGSGADGMFRWAACQLDILAKCLHPQAVEEALRTIPKTLSVTYDRMFQNIPAELKSDAIRLLQFLVYAKRPLKLSEAIDVIATLIQEEQSKFYKEHRPLVYMDLLLYCPGFVSIAKVSGLDHENGKEIHLSHFSIKQYLLNQSYFELETASITITKVCLTYLRDIEGDWESLEKCFPLARYVAEVLVDHARLAETSKEVAQEVEIFFQNDTTFQRWLELYQASNPWFEASGSHQESKLYYACYIGLLQMSKQLLSQGTDINAKGGYYGNALQAASARGHHKIAQLLLDRGADVNAQGGRYGNSLQAASVWGHHAVVKLLLDRGADMNGQDDTNRKPLHAASVWGHHAVVKLLLDRGADVNAQDGQYGSALLAASVWGRHAVVKLLLDRGADMNGRDYRYGSALQAASARGHHAVVQLLLDREADMKARDATAKTRLIDTRDE